MRCDAMEGGGERRGEEKEERGRGGREGEEDASDEP